MILDRFRLTGKVALVTGAGKGIGRGIALAFAEAGAQVVCAARTESDITAVVEEMRAGGGEGHAITCDVTQAEQMEALVAGAYAQYGHIDILVNNAGGTPPCPAVHLTDEEFEEAFHFNVSSAFHLSRSIVPRMVDEGRAGAIVNISSALSHMVDSGFVAYGTAKAALSHMTRLLAFEWAPHVRVNALAVGATLTDALEMFVAGGDLKQQMEELTPMGRLGTTEDIALAALYLASPASSWVTGKIFEIDGGTVDSNWPLKIPAF